jgi:hypothetical protein
VTYIDWKIKGPKIAACSCEYGCPCEFNGRPTEGLCEGLEAHRVDEGWFGDVRLDGLIYAARYRWPGAVHEGGGTVQGVIDKRATPEQVDALFKILGGEEQEPTTIFNIYGSTVETELDPVFADIAFSCDFERGAGGFDVPGVMSLVLEPIRNPVTGARHPAKIVLPTGFEFREADVLSGTFNGSGDLAFDRSKRYGAATYVAYGPYGLIDEESAPAVRAA